VNSRSAKLASLTATMLAVVACLPAAEGEQPKPAPAGDAQSTLQTYASERDAHQAGAVQAAAWHFARGMRAKEENRLADAVKDLALAVDYQPDNAEYKKQLSAVRALAGLERDPRSLQIDRVVDEAQVKEQELWAEAQARKEEGVKAMQAGDWNGADRSFQMAIIRLESMPFATEDRSKAIREVEVLAKEAHARREAKERDDASARTRLAAERSQQLRDAGMQLERDRIDAMLRRALRARERREFDEAILIAEQVLKINRADERAAELLTRCRRERHVYLRQMTADRWDEEHKLLSEAIRASMLPQLELVRYTTEWPELDARRTAPVHGLEEKSEAWRKEIDNQLEQEITLDFQDHDLVDVIAFLQRISNANIVLDPKVIAAAPPPVTLKVDKMKLKHVLDFIMKITGLNYTQRNEAIFISNQQGVRGDLFMKMYDVRDLTHAMSSFPGPDLDVPEPGGQGSRLLPAIESETKPEVSEFVDLIKRIVQPLSWSDEQQTTVEEFNGSMVVNQSATVHTQIDELLRNLRNQRGSQIHVKCKFLQIENSMLEEIGVSWQNYSPTGIPQPDGKGNNVVGNQFGAAWGEVRKDQMMTAGRINNDLMSYTSSTTLGVAAVDGMSLQTQTWQLGSNFFASAILNAVEKERRGNIVWEPDITLFNGQQAHIVNMNQQSYIGDYDVVQGQYDPIISVLSYGTVLDVQAIASADKKYITLTLRPTNAQVIAWRRFGSTLPGGAWPGGPVTTSGAAIASQAPLTIPQLSYNAVRTAVTIPDGGSLVIAGMTNGESRRSHAGVPFLSHIPFLGRLFSSNGRAETEMRNLIVVQADLVLFDEIEKKL
jgi:type II secretory pathway component GspD/PulD (secretin)